ncbi:NfeD family protein [Rhodopirellula bahusiensis]|uniref:Nodulation protein NfeD n=4 Tax=Rhodopirellula bahusiensis TaxID=2014065 RepID=A0A2G1W2K5_9BACT|nr:NfeD family protein [Rhodopirellula bahusiensis]PHQ33277.1 nodulation protein NfeD [Rhodopirellula bahusiensis]
MSGQRFVLVGFRHSVVPGWGRSLWCMLVILLGLLPIHLGLAQTDTSPKTGVLIDVPSPLNSRDVDRILARLSQIAVASKRGDASDRGRTTVVLRLGETGRGGQADSAAPSSEQSTPSEARNSAGGATAFEDALKIARAVSSSDLKRVRVVAWVDGAVSGHDVLLPLASETLLISSSGSIGDAGRFEPQLDDTIGVLYQSIARRRALIPLELVGGLVDSSLEVAKVNLIDGESSFLSGKSLLDARSAGRVASENTLANSGEPLVLDANQLRQIRAAAAIVDSEETVSDWLELSALQSDDSRSVDEAVGRLVRVTGNITGSRVRRWQSNLAATIDSPDVNTWLIAIDSPGGNLNRSASLAATLADPGIAIQAVGGCVTGEARGDAALIALACQPLIMLPDSTIGGSGADAMSPADVQRQSELIDMVADSTGRSVALIRGLLDPSLSVHRYVHRRSGRVRYATSDQIRLDSNENETSDWQRMEKIELASGLNASQAMELGLADGTSESLQTASAAVGLNGIPPELSDRGLVRWVERLGGQTGLAMSLLVVGFMMLSIEASAPGLGFPGFIALVCFAFFFWIKYLAGTAEWAELLAFGLGLACIGIEIFVLPGFGVFGVGGLILTAIGVMLMSQTFVVPQNAYQLGELTRGLWVTLGGLGGCVLGMILVRMYLPQAALATGLSMGVPEANLDESERLAHYDNLMGQTGEATTPLRPSGKARFGETIVPVVSDATAIDAGQSIRVIQVLGNRITVEAVD